MAIGAVLLLAAVAKGNSMASHAAYAERIAWLPPAAAPVVALGIPILEVACACAILAPATRRFGLYFAMTLLSLFTVFLVAQIAGGSNLACECFGEFRLAEDAMLHNRLSLVRNVLLLGLASLGLWRGPSNDAVAVDQEENLPNPASVPRAFTLVELLVVIGIIAVLISIILPSLAAARRKAQTLSCATNLREIGSLATLWASEHDGFLPLDGEVNYFLSDTGGDWPATVNDRRKRRYGYIVQENVSGDAERLDSFLVAMLRAASGDSAEDLLNRHVVNWNADVRSRLSASDTFHCPSAHRDHQWASYTGEGFRSMVLVFEGEEFAGPWKTTMDYSTNGGLLGFQSDRSRSHRAYRGQLSRAKNASTLVLAGDGDGDFMSWTPAADQPGQRVTLADVYAQNDEVTLWGHQKLPQLDAQRHDGSMNIVFVDGHVAAPEVTARGLASAELLQE